MGAELSLQKTQIMLTTQPLAVSAQYTVTAAGIFDRATPVANAIDPNADTATFTFNPTATGGGADGDDAPRVLGAASLDNTHVMVAFNRPMGSSALDAAAYFLTQEFVNPEVGTLVIRGAAFRENGAGQPDPSTVVLTTLPQSEVTYRVTVVGVRDASGTPLVPKRVVTGVLIDLNIALFPGTPPGSTGAGSLKKWRNIGPKKPKSASVGRAPSTYGRRATIASRVASVSR